MILPILQALGCLDDALCQMVSSGVINFLVPLMSLSRSADIAGIARVSKA
jgi:hypothetical protein